jgi:N6-L-threonylcarbamoyladenine synthase
MVLRTRIAPGDVSLAPSSRIVLGIETSCDETSAAVFAWREGGRPEPADLRANVVASQVDLHARYGGVVPELASRRHLERLGAVIDEALERAGVPLAEIGAVAVTCGPGLVGALTVGVAAAKSLAFASGRPLIGVNHLEGHIYASVLDHPDLALPALALIVSGAHTDLVLMTGHGQYEVIGRTRDDAAGEAFDKVARALGLGYPGGPALERLARRGRPNAVRFPRPFPDEHSLDFSFSGLKTAVLRTLGRTSRDAPAEPPDEQRAADVAAAFQDALVGVLVAKALRAARARGARSILLAGGVAANSVLRERLTVEAAGAGLPCRVPPLSLCTDNAGMIAVAGAYRLARGERSSLRLGAYADLDLGEPVPETG